MSDLAELVAKLESASEGSEELDVAIQRRLCGYADDNPMWHCPPYTRSLDAALWLVPEGWWWHVSHLEAVVTPTHPVEELGRALNGDWACSNAARAPSRVLILHNRKRTALALCIAALRARSAA